MFSFSHVPDARSFTRNVFCLVSAALATQSSEVHAILSPHPDTVERILHPLAVDVEIWQDDRPIHDHQRGADVTEDGRLIVNRPRAYNLIRNPKFESHELTLRVKTHGFALYAFAFTGAARD
jgi:hypothetical protein